MGNTTCPAEYKPIDPVPFYSHGGLNFKAHDVGWIICGFFTLIASGASFWLIWKHLTYYTCPQQQRHIVRMLFMVPIYAIVSLLSYVFYHQAIYYQTIRDCYEAVVITSFFYLLLQYVGDTPAEQHEVFRMVKLKKWFWPLGFWKYRPSGLHFLWLMKICILQYAIVRPLCTLVAVGLQFFGLYCLESWEPYFGHIYISIAISLSVTVAMYCIIQFYMPIQEELKPYSPVLKFLAIKSVVFLTFWQDSFLSILVYFGAIKESQYMTAADIQVGINALLETFEMVIFGFLHIKAFTYLVYRPKDRTRVTRKLKALLDVLDYRDWYYQMRQSTRYVAAKTKGRDYTIVEDIRREKYDHLEKAMGRDRWTLLSRERDQGKERMPTFWKAGCEPKDGEQSDSVDVEKSVAQAESTTLSPSKSSASLPSNEPRGNAAMHPDYDPENDQDKYGPIDNAADESALLDSSTRSTNRSLPLPTLPKIDVSSIRVPFNRTEKYPELTQYHRAATFDDEGVPNDWAQHERQFRSGVDGLPEEELDIFIPRKGGRARKEASAGLGAFWRAFRQRISGSGIEAEKAEDADVDIVTHDDQMNGEREQFLPPRAQPQRSDSNAESDASQSALERIHSPLTEIIREHGVRSPQIDSGREMQERKQDLPTRVGIAGNARPVSIVQSNGSGSDPLSGNVRRHRSDRAHVSPHATPQENLDNAAQPTGENVPAVTASANAPNPASATNAAAHGQTPLSTGDKLYWHAEERLRALPDRLGIAQGHESGHERGWEAMAVNLQSSSMANSRRPSPQRAVSNVTHNSDSTSDLTSLSTAALQRQRAEKERQKASMTLLGPKGRKIAVVLPQPLSSDGLHEEPSPPTISSVPAQPGPGSRIDSSYVVSSNIRSPSDRTRIRFTEVKPPRKDPKDDPEAEVPNVSGWVVAGGQSLKQSRLKRQEAEKRQKMLRAQARGEDGRESERAEVVGLRQSDSDPQSILVDARPRAYSGNSYTGAHPTSAAHASATRSRRTSTPSAPYVSSERGIGAAETTHKSSSRRPASQALDPKKRSTTEAQAFTALLAPSQLSGLDGGQDPFGAAKAAMTSPSAHRSIGTSPDRDRSHPLGFVQDNRSTTHSGGHRASSGQSSLQIGSIVTRRDVADAMAPGQPVRPTFEHTHRSSAMGAQYDLDRNPYNSHTLQGNSMQHGVPLARPRRGSSPSALSSHGVVAPLAWPGPPNAVGSRHPMTRAGASFRQSRVPHAAPAWPHPVQGPQSTYLDNAVFHHSPSRPSRQSTLPALERSRYDPFTGEPQRTSMRRATAPSFAVQQQDGQTQRYQPAQEEQREGFHFDYID